MIFVFLAIKILSGSQTQISPFKFNGALIRELSLLLFFSYSTPLTPQPIPGLIWPGLTADDAVWNGIRCSSVYNEMNGVIIFSLTVCLSVCHLINCGGMMAWRWVNRAFINSHENKSKSIMFIQAVWVARAPPLPRCHIIINNEHNCLSSILNYNLLKAIYINFLLNFFSSSETFLLFLIFILHSFSRSTTSRAHIL